MSRTIWHCRSVIFACLTLSLSAAPAWSQGELKAVPSIGNFELIDSGNIDLAVETEPQSLGALSKNKTVSQVVFQSNEQVPQEASAPNVRHAPTDYFQRLAKAKQQDAVVQQEVSLPLLEVEMILMQPQTPSESPDAEDLPPVQGIRPPNYIDSALCERLNKNAKCENPSMLEGDLLFCGNCQSCRYSQKNSVVRENIRRCMARSRYIYERTLLGDPRLFCERHFGSYVNSVVRAQIGAGQQKQMVLFRYDFQQTATGQPTAQLKNTSLMELERIGKSMLQTGMPMVIERTGNTALDNRRRVVVAQTLATLGFEANTDSVLAERPVAVGQSGVEAEMQHRARIGPALRGVQDPASGGGSDSGGDSGGGGGGMMLE